MSSTAVMSVLGFGFWIFVAHLYKPSQIGIASALISMTTLLSNLSLLGFNAGLIRFLPKSKNQSRDINAAMVVVAAATLVAATLYIIIASLLHANLSLLSSEWSKIAFVFIMTSVSLNSLTDAVFIANRRAEFHTAAYAVLGVCKLLLPLGLVSLGALGIFLAYIVAMVVSLIFSLFMMRRWCGYRFLSLPNWGLIGRIKTYTTNNYLGVVLAGLPSQLLPMLLLKRLGSADVAYFSMAWTMANLLYVIPSAASQSLLAEGSHEPGKRFSQVGHTIKLLSIILIPVVIVSVLIAPYLLDIFGKQYSAGGTAVFRILAVVTLPLAITSIYNTLLNLEQRTGGIVVSQLALLVVTFGSVGFLLHLGLPGVGLAILLGNIASGITHSIQRFSRRRRLSKKDDGLKLSSANIRDMLASFGIYDFTYRNLGNGSTNYTLLITTPRKKMVLRVYNNNLTSSDSIDMELAYMRFLGERNLPVPSIIPNKQGRPLSLLADGSHTWRFLMMRYEPGTHPEQYSQALITDMAFYQAAIHSYSTTFSPHMEDDGKSPNFRIRRPRVHRRIGGLQGYSHFDYDSSNVLAKDDNITCILDFEGMRYGLLVSCIYFTLTRIYDESADAALLRQYISTYKNVRSLSLIERLILNIALAAHYHSPKLLTTA